MRAKYHRVKNLLMAAFLISFSQSKQSSASKF